MIEVYQRIVKRGAQPEEKSLARYHQDARDRMETLDTPAGPAEIVLLYDRHDFEIFLRNMMAAKDGPYSAVSAEKVGLSADVWKTIRMRSM